MPLLLNWGYVYEQTNHGEKRVVSFCGQCWVNIKEGVIHIYTYVDPSLYICAYYSIHTYIYYILCVHINILIAKEIFKVAVWSSVLATLKIIFGRGPTCDHTHYRYILVILCIIYDGNKSDPAMIYFTEKRMCHLANAGGGGEIISTVDPTTKPNHLTITLLQNHHQTTPHHQTTLSPHHHCAIWTPSQHHHHPNTTTPHNKYTTTSYYHQRAWWQNR